MQKQAFRSSLRERSCIGFCSWYSVFSGRILDSILPKWNCCPIQSGSGLVTLHQFGENNHGFGSTLCLIPLFFKKNLGFDISWIFIVVYGKNLGLDSSLYSAFLPLRMKALDLAFLLQVFRQKTLDFGSSSCSGIFTTVL